METQSTLTDVIKTAMPLVVASYINGTRTLTECLLVFVLSPLITTIIQKIYDSIKNWWYIKPVENTTVSLQINEKECDTQEPIPFYIAVNWYLEKYLQNNNTNVSLEIKTKGTSRGDSQHGRMYNSLVAMTKGTLSVTYEVTTNSKYSLTWNNEEFGFEFLSTRRENSIFRSIMLSSKRMVEIKKFVDHCVSEFTDNQQKEQDGSLKIFLITNERYAEQIWVPQKLYINKNFDNVFLESNTKNRLIEDIDVFIASREEYHEFGMAFKRGYLFYGTPGTGKSSTIYAIATHLNRNIYSINCSVLNNDRFCTAIKSIPPKSIVVFEDIDTAEATKKRVDSSVQVANNSSKQKSSLDLGLILESLDGYLFLQDCIVIITTNHIENLDPALIRPGRIDIQIEFKHCCFEQLELIIHKFFSAEIWREMNIDKERFEAQKLAVSKIVSTIIAPNRNNWRKVLELLFEDEKNESIAIKE